MIYMIMLIVDNSTDAEGIGLELAQAAHVSSNFCSEFHLLTCQGPLCLVQKGVQSIDQSE